MKKTVLLLFFLLIAIFSFSGCGSAPYLPDEVCEYGSVVCEYSNLVCQTVPEACPYITIACLNITALCDTTLTELEREYHKESLELSNKQLKLILENKK